MRSAVENYPALFSEAEAKMPQLAELLLSCLLVQNLLQLTMYLSFC